MNNSLLLHTDPALIPPVINFTSTGSNIEFKIPVSDEKLTIDFNNYIYTVNYLQQTDMGEYTIFSIFNFNNVVIKNLKLFLNLSVSITTSN